MTKYTIISDLHIGSDVCQRDKIITLLKKLKTKHLILNGDIIDVNHIKRLKKKDWQILSLLRKISKETEIIYLRGNHDFSIGETISELLGFEFKISHDFVVNDKKFHVVHGDCFDFFMAKFGIITGIATAIYYFIQKFSTKSQILARSIKRRSKNFVKCCENVKLAALNFAYSKDFSYIICGHVHAPYFNKDSIYVNGGCFTEVDCSYVEIDDSGKVEVKIV